MSPASRSERRALRAAEGFTLIEMLVVISVIAILAAVVSPMVFQHVGSAKESAARAQVEILSLALDAYRLDNDHYPSTEQGLAALVAPPVGEPPAVRWRGPYLRRAVPLDPWGNPYTYRGPSLERPFEFRVASLGRDGKEGGQGEDADVQSWTEAGP